MPNDGPGSIGRKYSHGEIFEDDKEVMIEVKSDVEIKQGPVLLSPRSERRTYFERTFSSMEKGSIRGSIFALSASAVGSGVLSLPYVLRLNGYVAGVVFMIVAALAAQTTLKMLASVACEYKLKSYSAVCQQAGGKKL